MGIQRLKNSDNGIFDYSKYPKKFNIYADASSVPFSFTEVIRIEGEGFVELAIGGFYGTTSGGTNICSVRITVDGNVLVDADYSSASSGTRYAGFYDRNKIQDLDSSLGVGYGFKVSSSIDRDKPLNSALQWKNTSRQPGEPFPITTIDTVSILDKPIEFTTSVVVELRKTGYFHAGSALVCGGVK
jgi:hypothetical protein